MRGLGRRRRVQRASPLVVVTVTAFAQGLVRRRRKIGERHRGKEKHGCRDPGRLGQEIAGTTTTEHLLSRRASECSQAAALAWLKQHDEYQEQARNDVHYDKGGFKKLTHGAPKPGTPKRQVPVGRFGFLPGAK